MPFVNWVLCVGRRRAGARVPLRQQARRHLRRRGHRDVHPQHAAVPRRRPALWGTPRRKLALLGALFLTVEVVVLQLQRREDRPRRLAVARGRAGRSPTVMITWRRGRDDRHAQPQRAGRAAAATSSTVWPPPTRRSCACRASPSSSTRARTRRRWRCAREVEHNHALHEQGRDRLGRARSASRTCDQADRFDVELLGHGRFRIYPRDVADRLPRQARRPRGADALLASRASSSATSTSSTPPTSSRG